MVVIELFGRFLGLVKDAVPGMVKANGDARNEIITVVSNLAAELQEGMALVALYLRGTRRIESLPEACDHLLACEEKLIKYHSEFKICLGLRMLGDRFHRLLDTLPAAVQMGKRGEIDALLYELGKSEALIIHEFSTLWSRIDDTVKSATTVEDLHPLIDAEVAHAERMSRDIGEKARQILATI